MFMHVQWLRCAISASGKFLCKLLSNMAKTVMKRAMKKKNASFVHFSPFLRGVIYGLFIAGYTYREIADEVEKADGTHPCHASVASVVEQAEQLGGMSWSGQPAHGEAGRPRHTSNALDKAI